MVSVAIERVVVKSFRTDNPDNMFGFGCMASGNKGDVFLHYGNASRMVRYCNKVYLNGENEREDPVSKKRVRLRVPCAGDELICGLVPSPKKGSQWKVSLWGYANAIDFFEKEIHGKPLPTYRLLRTMGHWNEMHQTDPEVLWEGLDVMDVCDLYPIKKEWKKGHMVVDDPLRDFHHDDGISIQYRFEKTDTSGKWSDCSDVRHFKGAISIRENLDSMLAVIALA